MSQIGLENQVVFGEIKSDLDHNLMCIYSHKQEN